MFEHAVVRTGSWGLNAGTLDPRNLSSSWIQGTWDSEDLRNLGPSLGIQGTWSGLVPENLTNTAIQEISSGSWLPRNPGWSLGILKNCEIEGFYFPQYLGFFEFRTKIRAWHCATFNELWNFEMTR